MPSRPIICEPGQAKPRKGRIEWCWSNPSTDLKAGTVPRLHAGSHPRPPPQLYHQKMCLCSKSRPLIQVPCLQSIYWLPWKAESILVPEVRAWWPPPFRFAALQPETPQKRLACYSPPTPFTVQKSPWFSIASSSIADHTLAIACSSSNLALRIGDLHLGIKACMRSALGVWKVGGGHSTWYRRRFLGIGSTYWGRRRQHPAISAL